MMRAEEPAEGIKRFFFLSMYLFLTFTGVAMFAGDVRCRERETLYNGIRLPAEWPPRIEAPTFEPMSPPYLESPPPVIPINVGRQLFVDDFLIEETTMLRRHHTPVPYEGNPVLTHDKPWEKKGAAPTAMVFSDGVWYDPLDGLYKMWYMGGYTLATCYAVSGDGVHWYKPSLDVVPGTNIVHPRKRDSGVVWLDHEERNPDRRFKMFLRVAGPRNGFAVFWSPDGIHWGDPVHWAGPQKDRTTVFYNPFRKVWVYSIKDYDGEGIGRYRRYFEGPDPVSAADWKEGEPVFWVGADRLDPVPPGMHIDHAELYNLDAVAYESLIVGLFTVWKGPPNNLRDGRPKLNQVFVGYTRDGFHWSRPLRRPFIAASGDTTAWNWGNVQSAGGCFLVVKDKLYFYYSGRTGLAIARKSTAEGATGLSVLRRDGFVSMDAGEEERTLTTRPVVFSGKRLFVNADARAGALRVEILDRGGEVIAPFSKDNCVPMKTDSTLEEIRWKGADDLSPLAGKEVRFRFHLENGSLFSFWVGPDESGASFGYVAAGGPGFRGPIDDVGRAVFGVGR